jgi:hypothetical protein
MAQTPNIHLVDESKVVLYFGSTPTPPIKEKIVDRHLMCSTCKGKAVDLGARRSALRRVDHTLKVGPQSGEWRGGGDRTVQGVKDVFHTDGWRSLFLSGFGTSGDRVPAYDDKSQT